MVKRLVANEKMGVRFSLAALQSKTLGLAPSVLLCVGESKRLPAIFPPAGGKIATTRTETVSFDSPYGSSTLCLYFSPSIPKILGKVLRKFP